MATFKVTLRKQHQYVRGHDDIKLKYDIMNENSGDVICALEWNLLDGHPIVYDQRFDEHVDKHTWSKCGSGYSWNKQIGYMHSFIASLAGMEVPPGMSIDHINGCKMDNRLKNLRIATQSQQNSNRGTRSDKLPPCKELVDNGITELPRYVRWDNTESKFVIEKHPALLDEVRQGKRKKATMSGSKSKAISTLEKYQDILARLQQLDDVLNNADDISDIRRTNKMEYDMICACINAYENRVVHVPEQSNDPPNVEPVRRTAAGKKTVSKLPEDCGVKHDDIPKYCYYKPASDKRGDKFIIDRHPTLIKQGSKQWATTERKSVSTKEKFEQMMAKYQELNMNSN